MTTRIHTARTALLIALTMVGCDRTRSGSDAAESHAAAKREVVVYVAHDRQFSEPVLDEFTRRSGIVVRAAYDTESTKTVGLVNRIRAEANRPRCDVFWNNEIMHMLRLKSEGLLQPCHPANAKAFAPAYQDADHCWYGFAARARVLLVNTELVPADKLPRSIFALADSHWRGRVGIAKPLFGTTATHVACIFAMLGEDRGTQWLESMRRNEIQIMGGNKACAEAVGAGRLAFALTDTDDAIAEVDARRPVRIVFPDASDDGVGTLLLPNTLAVIRGAPHAADAEKLIDFLLSGEVETLLARGEAAQIPLRGDAAAQSRVGKRDDIRAMQVDWNKAAQAFDPANEAIKTRFLGD